MENLVISSLSLKLLKDFQNPNQSWVYCVLKWGDQTYCTKPYEIKNKDWTQLFRTGSLLEMELPKGHHLFKIEVWSYDNEKKIGQTSITNSDLTINQNQKQFSINDRKIHFKFCYERKAKAEQSKQSQINTMRVNYNRSDPNILKAASKPTSPSMKPTVQQGSQYQIGPIRYEPSSYGRWKFIPTRHDSANQKLKL